MKIKLLSDFLCEKYSILTIILYSKLEMYLHGTFTKPNSKVCIIFCINNKKIQNKYIDIFLNYLFFLKCLESLKLNSKIRSCKFDHFSPELC